MAQQRAVLALLKAKVDPEDSGNVPSTIFIRLLTNLGVREIDAETLVKAMLAEGGSSISCEQFIKSIFAEESRPLNMVLFGAPGSGKGTQCDKLKKDFGLRHISTGDVLRDHVNRGTPLGAQAKEYMDAGKLVPDELMIGLIKEETKDAHNGWLIDGMPRTRVQAEAMTQMGLDPRVFVTLEVPDEVLEERITLRRMDPATGDIYHLKFKPPRDPEVERRLTQRKDDTAEKLRTRLEAYHANLSKVKEFYKKRGSLVELDGVSTGIDGVYAGLLSSLLESMLRDMAEAGPLKLVLFGAPGSGKGTQCDKLKTRFGLRHISTGDVLRDHVKRGTPLGTRAKGYMEAGKLVPDELIIGLIKEETKEANHGWLIDGMPRTRVQAEAMSAMGLNPQAFVTLEVPDSVLAERITLRRMDPVTGDIYHLKFKPPTSPEVEARLTQRKDDTVEALTTRLEAYHHNLSPVKEFYKKQGILVELDGASGGIDGVYAELLASLLKTKLA